MKSLISVFCVCAALALFAFGCAIPGSVTGGGWIPSADGVAGDKANFGFSASQCDLSQPATGNLNYHDKTSKFSAPGSVKLNGPILDAGQCVVNSACSTDSDCTAEAGGTCVVVSNQGYCSYPGEGSVVGCGLCVVALGTPLPPKTYGFDVNYSSTNTAYPGSGVASVCVVDNGQGSKASAKDFAIIAVESGPYQGYANSGLVQGNISGTTCP